MTTHAGHDVSPIRYFDSAFGMDTVKILPGEYFVTLRDMLIVTVLGSCVSVCLRDRISGIGGMNHFMLPSDPLCGQGLASESARYGTFAMDVLIDHLLKLGAVRKNLEAKIFGGGAVIANMTTTPVGERNVEFAQTYLRSAGIPIAASDLLDIYARKVYFFPRSGHVLVKKIKSMNNPTILDREVEYRRRLRAEPVEDDIDPFT